MKKLVSVLLSIVIIGGMITLPVRAERTRIQQFCRVAVCNGEAYTADFYSTNGNITFRSGEVNVLPFPADKRNKEVCSLAVYGGKLYYVLGYLNSDPSLAQIWSCNIDGSNASMIADDAYNFSNAFIYDGYIYYAAYDRAFYFEEEPSTEKYEGGIYKVSIDGSDKRKIVNKSNVELGYCDGFYIYYNKDGGYTFFCDLNGNNEQSSAEYDERCFSNQLSGSICNPNSGMCYWRANQSIWSGEINTRHYDDNKKLFDFDGDVYPVAVSDDTLYYINMVEHNNNGYYAYLNKVNPNGDVPTSNTLLGSTVSEPAIDDIALEIGDYIYYYDDNKDFDGNDVGQGAFDAIWVYDKNTKEKKQVLEAGYNIQQVGNKLFAISGKSSSSSGRNLYCFDYDGSNIKHITSGLDYDIVDETKSYSVYNGRIYFGFDENMDNCGVKSCDLNGDDVRVEVKPIYAPNHRCELYETYAVIDGAVYPYSDGKDNTISVTIDNKEVIFETLPVIYNDRTMVPMRAIFEALGASVNWDGATRTITSERSGTTIKITIGSNIIYVNGNEVEFDTSPMLIGDYTYVPVRVIAESFNSEVGWDGNTKTVAIKNAAKPTTTPKPTATPKPVRTPKPAATPTATPVPDVSILTLYTDSNTAYRNGEKQYIDEDNLNVTPVVIDGRTLVPMRYISEVFGGSVDWDNDTQKATIKVGSDEIKLFAGKNYILINGIAHDLDTPAQIIEGRTMIPLRAFAEAIGQSVEYYSGLIIIGSRDAVDDMMQTDLDKYISENFAVVPTGSGTTDSKAILEKFLNNDFENMDITMLDEEYKSIENAESYRTCKQQIAQYHFVDMDNDGEDELIIRSKPLFKENEFPEMYCISIWDYENAEINCILAKNGMWHRANYHYDLINYDGFVCLYEQMTVGNSGGAYWERNIYKYENSKLTKLKYVLCDYAYYADRQETHLIDGVAVTRDEAEKAASSLDNELDIIPW